MEVRLDGTAGSDGWPAPGCGCASCGRLPPGHRGPTSVVLDGRVRLASLLDCRPASGLADGFRVVRSPDGHEITGPDGSRVLYALPPHRGGAAAPPTADPFDLVLIDLLDRPDRLGDLRRRGRVTARTRVVAVHLDHRIGSEDELHRRLALWQASVLPDGAVLRIRPAVPGGFPPQSVAVPPHADPPHTVRPHAAPDIPRRDGEPLARSEGADRATGPTGSAPPGTAGALRPRRTLLLGGARSGKSEEAELRVAGDAWVTYVATGLRYRDGDPEWQTRVRAHRARRPSHWRTVESIDLAVLLDRPQPPGREETLLIDGIGTWLAAVFDECGAWPGDPDPDPGPPGEGAVDQPWGAPGAELVAARCDQLVAAWRRTRARVVAVSDEVGLGIVPGTPSGRVFRDMLGRLNQRLARESEEVALVVAGRPIPLPG